MFTEYNTLIQTHPIKIWLDDFGQVEPGCQEQVLNLSRLPFLHKWPALMPDCHQGYGMPVGGVIATNGVIIPNAVGVDIGCGMGFVQTNIPSSLLQTLTPQGTLIQAIVGSIMRNIPVGFGHHRDKQECISLTNYINYLCDDVTDEELDEVSRDLLPEVYNGFYQVGTLGGGNHFIEIQEDESGHVGLMLHSGSRNFGYKICKHFNNIAKVLNQKWHVSIPGSYDLAFLPSDSREGKQYINWMNLALDFAAENRSKMMFKSMEILLDHVRKYTDFEGIVLGNQINCHHNYAAIENHFDKNVWVHRKGAIRARQGDVGIIPGSMGSFSYIVEGLGNPDSFMSSSHGAGRNASRTKAKEKYSAQEVIEDLERLGVTLGKNKKSDVAEECRWAYKDIDTVIRQESDLVKVTKQLKTIGVIKG